MADRWRDITLGDFVALQRGHDLTEPQRRIGRFPVMGSAGENGFHDTALAKGPGIVIGRSGASFGQVHFSKEDFWPHNTGLYVTDFKGNDPLFAFYFLKAIDFDRFNSGSAQPSLNRNFIYPILIRVPKPAEQKAIAAILGSLDDKIELNRRMNATLEAMARALFQSWFVDFDPVRAKLDGRVPVGMDAETAALFPARFDESALGHIPHGWRLGRFGDLCNLKLGHDLPTSTRNVGLIPVISSSGISGMHSETNVRGPGVVTGRYGTIGKVFFVETDYWPLNTTLYVEDFKKNPPRFIFHALGEVNFSNYTDKAAVPGVNRNHLHEEPTVISSMEVRQAFANIVEPLWTKHATNCVQSRSLATLRDTLLPKLLSGELRVAGLESIFAATQ